MQMMSLEEPIGSNTFDQYFSPITFRSGNVIISWEEPGHMKVDIKADPNSYGFYYHSEQVGMNVEIPSTLLQATYAFKFKINPQTRIKETKTVNLLWYGAGYDHAEYWGTVSWPLFRMYLDAATNHVHLIFDGSIQVQWGIGGLKNIWPFGVWDVDLGDETNFKDWTWFVIQIDPQDRSFTRIIVGGKDIPFPPGFDKLKPDLNGENMVKGIFVGNLTGEPCTNAQFLIDDVYVYPTYWVPPGPPVPSCNLFMWLIIVSSISVGVILVYKNRESALD
jgi:hypothetical protein